MSCHQLTDMSWHVITDISCHVITPLICYLLIRAHSDLVESAITVVVPSAVRHLSSSPQQAYHCFLFLFIFLLCLLLPDCSSRQTTCSLSIWGVGSPGQWSRLLTDRAAHPQPLHERPITPRSLPSSELRRVVQSYRGELVGLTRKRKSSSGQWGHRRRAQPGEIWLLCY